jgi:1-phosphofructokinase family hexose kinase
VIVTLTPNPALDVTYEVDAVQLGETIRPVVRGSRPGGKGINVARVLASAGLEVIAVASVAEHDVEPWRSELAGAGIVACLLPSVTDTRRTIALVESSGRTTMIAEPGVAPSISVLDELVSAATAELDSDDVLVVSGSLPAGVPPDFVGSAVKLAAERGALIVVDTSGPALLLAAEAGATVLRPNLREAIEATGASNAIEAARLLVARGAEAVLLGLGSEGMIAVGRDEPQRVLRARLVQPLTGNPTGAGDAATAAVASLLERDQRDLRELLMLAVEWSAAALLMPLAGEIAIDRSDIARAIVFDEPNTTEFGRVA